MAGVFGAFAAPALVAGAAYLDAKLQLWEDLSNIATFVSTDISIARKAKHKRLNPFYVLEDHAHLKSTSGRPFLCYEGKEWTFKEVYEIVLKYGTWLKQKHGVKRHEVVAIDLMNSPQFVFIWLGLWSIGATPAFINYNLKGESLAHSVSTSGAKLLLLEEEVAQSLSSEDLAMTNSGRDGTGGKAYKIVVLLPDVEAEILSTPSIREPDKSREASEPQELAILISTSGTTGYPKAAIVSWAKIIRSAEFISSIMSLRTSDRYYSCMPLYHSTAALLGFGCVLVSGSSYVIGRRFSSRTYWEDVRRHDATVIQYVGETCRYLLAASPQHDIATGKNLDKKHNVRLAFGNGLRPDIWQRFKDRFGIETILEFYGATEAPVGVWNLSRNKSSLAAVGRNGSLGTLLLSRRLACVEVDWSIEEPLRDKSTGFCKKTKSGMSGELIAALDPANTQLTYQGYHGNRTSTDSKILRDVFQKGDVYFRTGDVLRWDGEGRFFFVDRIGDTFRWKAENVSTNEVSEAFGVVPEIIETNVYGVQIPHHDGRAGCAAIQLDASLSDERAEMAIRDAAKSISQRLQKHAVPLFLRVVPQHERTGTNKQTKARFRDAGVDPRKLAQGESLWWLRKAEYVPFTPKDWNGLQEAAVKL